MEIEDWNLYLRPLGALFTPHGQGPNRSEDRFDKKQDVNNFFDKKQAFKFFPFHNIFFWMPSTFLFFLISSIPLNTEGESCNKRSGQSMTAWICSLYTPNMKEGQGSVIRLVGFWGQPAMSGSLQTYHLMLSCHPPGAWKKVLKYDFSFWVDPYCLLARTDRLSEKNLIW